MLGLSDYEFVLYEAKPPLPTDETSEADKLFFYEKWNKANTTAMRLIRTSISEVIHVGISIKDTGKELLDLINIQFVGTMKQLQYYYLTQGLTRRLDMKRKTAMDLGIG
ncbi:3beta-hydroxysteroid-4alpha-carboxylate 3-dehydrogenase [Sarracenia purpurea var. burkii]